MFSPSDVVVIADDETYSRFIAAEILERLGSPTVLTARDGTEALSMLGGVKADAVRLVLLDFDMPPPNGVEVLKAVRSGELGVAHDVPVMMVTGADAFCLVAAAMALDVDAFLVKPLSVARLRDHWQAVAAEHRSLAAPGHYAAVDVDGLVVRRREVERGASVPLDGLVEGMVVADDLVSPSGDLLVAAGTTVDARLARLLRGLAAAGLPCGHVAVAGN